MDSLYDQLYAMADIVGGAMRQEGPKPKERTKVILSAIDNFRNFAEVLMNNANEKSIVSQEAIARHPVSFVKAEEKVAEKAEETRTEFEGLVERSSAEMLTKVEEMITATVETFTAKLEELEASVPVGIEEATEKMAKVTDDLEATIKAVREDVDTLQKSPKKPKSERNEEIKHKDDEKGFKGTIFRNKE